jgi:hypothetical protein
MKKTTYRKDAKDGVTLTRIGAAVIPPLLAAKNAALGSG